MEYGAPQGSCLGPLLFLLFTNDLYLNIEHCSAILFVDDTKVYKSHRNTQYLKWCIEQDLKTVSDWFKQTNYRSGTVNSNTVNSKFHLIRSCCEYLARFLSFHV